MFIGKLIEYFRMSVWWSNFSKDVGNVSLEITTVLFPNRVCKISILWSSFIKKLKIRIVLNLIYYFLFIFDSLLKFHNQI